LRGNGRLEPARKKNGFSGRGDPGGETPKKKVSGRKAKTSSLQTGEKNINKSRKKRGGRSR